MAYTNIDDPSAFFHVQTYTGTGPNQDVANDAHSGNFKPDLLWIKNRTYSNYGAVCYDSSRGVKRQFYFAPDSYGDDAEGYNADGQSSVQLFNTNGYRGGSSSNIYAILWINGLDAQYVAWQWQINGGTTSSNSDGNISSTVQVNQDAGLSVVLWTGTGSGTANPKIGHGLGVTPNVIFAKTRSQNNVGWVAYHSGIDGTNSKNKYIFPHDNDAAGTLANYWGTATSGGVTSSTFGVYADNQSGNNYLNSTYVAYCFAEKQGFSKFGRYTGNGSANGAFVYTGFKPAFVMVKRTDSTGSWIINDRRRNGYNPDNLDMYLNLTDDDEDNDRFDLLSNGFKARSTSAVGNASTGNYIYMAFAENPFTTSTGIPTTAR